jgi:hypothetical protein
MPLTGEYEPRQKRHTTLTARAISQAEVEPPERLNFAPAVSSSE